MGLGKFLSGLFSGGDENPGDANKLNDAAIVKSGEVNSPESSASAPPPSAAETRAEESAPAPSLEAAASDGPSGEPTPRCRSTS